MNKESLRPRKPKEPMSQTDENKSEECNASQVISTTQLGSCDLVASLLNSCQMQYKELAEERREHQKQLQWERERQEEREEEREQIAKEEREMERKRLDKLDETAREEREQRMKREKDEWNLRMKELELRQEALLQQELLTKSALEDKRTQDDKKRKQRLADKMPMWSDNDLPDAYLSKFKLTMIDADIPYEEWSARLIALLSGKALRVPRHSNARAPLN